MLGLDCLFSFLPLRVFRPKSITVFFFHAMLLNLVSLGRPTTCRSGPCRARWGETPISLPYDYTCTWREKTIAASWLFLTTKYAITIPVWTINRDNWLAIFQQKGGIPPGVLPSKSQQNSAGTFFATADKSWLPYYKWNRWLRMTVHRMKR